MKEIIMKISINMNYKKALLELIKGKMGSKDSRVGLSLQEIADAWNRKMMQKDRFMITKTESIDYNFLQDVFDTIKILEDEKYIKFDSIFRHWSAFLTDKDVHEKQSISDITELFSPQDKIFLEITGNLDKKADKEVVSKKSLEYLVKERSCYLKILNTNIKIGKTNTRKCKLLQCLFNPFGIAKTTDIVFGDIQLPKDKQNRDLWDGYLGKTKKESIIRTTGKEIQRILSKNKLKKRLIFHIKNRWVWIELD